MWNPILYQKAIDFAATAHKDQLVKGKTYQYVVHLSNVAAEVARAMFEEKPKNPDLLIQWSLLHDVLEDTETTEESVEKIFGTEVLNGIKALTKNPNLNKEDQINDSLEKILNSNKEVAWVKLADRITNLQEPPPNWDKEKIKKYLEDAKKIYSKLNTFNKYLGQRLKDCIEDYKKYI